MACSKALSIASRWPSLTFSLTNKPVRLIFSPLGGGNARTLGGGGASALPRSRPAPPAAPHHEDRGEGDRHQRRHEQRAGGEPQPAGAEGHADREGHDRGRQQPV